MDNLDLGVGSDAVLGSDDVLVFVSDEVPVTDVDEVSSSVTEYEVSITDVDGVSVTETLILSSPSDAAQSLHVKLPLGI